MVASDDPVQRQINRFWNVTAEGYEEHPGNLPNEAGRTAWEAFVRDELPRPPADVLDVGTGTGFLALLAAAAGHRVVGVDLADGMVRVATRRREATGLDARFMLGDAVAPPFPDGSFDVVMSRHLLWTLREPAAAFANWRRLLRPGGYVLAIDGQWLSPVPEAGDPRAHEESDSESIFDAHYTPETRAALPLVATARETLAPLLRDAGFSQVVIRDLPRSLWTQVPVEGAPYVVLARL